MTAVVFINLKLILPKYTGNNIAVEYMNSWYDILHYDIVITNRSFNINDVEQLLINAGIKAKLHAKPLTPKAMSSYKVNEVFWWFNTDEEIKYSMIVESDHSLKGLDKHHAAEKEHYEQLHEKYIHIKGIHRRKHLIPLMDTFKIEKPPSENILSGRIIEVDTILTEKDFENGKKILQTIKNI